MRTFKIHFLNRVLLSTVIMLYIKSPWFTYFTTESLYVSTLFTHFASHPPPLATHHSLCDVLPCCQHDTSLGPPWFWRWWAGPEEPPADEHLDLDSFPVDTRDHDLLIWGDPHEAGIGDTYGKSCRPEVTSELCNVEWDSLDLLVLSFLVHQSGRDSSLPLPPRAGS